MPAEQVANPFSYISMHFDAIVTGLKYRTLERTLWILERAAREKVDLSCYQLMNEKFPCRGVCPGCVLGGSMSGKIKKIKEMIDEGKRRQNKPGNDLPID